AGLKGDLYAFGGGGQGARNLELIVDAPPEGNGWIGISGAPVFVGDKLAGIIKSHLPAYEAKRLDASPITQIYRSRGFLTSITPQRIEPSSNRHWCLILVSENQKQNEDDLKLKISSAIKRKITEHGKIDFDEEPRVLNVTDAVETRARWLQAVDAICRAPVMI